MREILSLFFLLLFMAGQAQTDSDHWEAYMAQYDDGPGSTTVNMSLKKKPAFAKHPYLLITGVRFSACKDGFPKSGEFETLYAVSDSVQQLVKETGVNPVHAGSFTQNCERLDYLYVTDTAGLRQKLTALYKKRFPNYKPSIRFRADKNWEAYHRFLYPSETIMDYISNSKVVLKLQEAGDKLEKTRPIDHFLYFKTEANRQAFIATVSKEKFTVAAKEKVKGVHPFRLHLIKVEKTELGSISKTTLYLKNTAEKYKGVYDGWESVIVK